jgi:hypothetical protein
MVPYSHGWLYLPGETESTKIGTLVFQSDGSFTPTLSWEGPIEEFSLATLKGTVALGPPLRRVRHLMDVEGDSDLARALLTSIEWAGRATVETKRELALILFMIALETLLIPESRGSGSYRLGVRVAHLLGSSSSSRAEQRDTVKRLYEIRSRIVHDGSYEASSRDLDQLRTIVRGAILRVLLDRGLRKLSTKSELRVWFEKRVLR